MPNSGYRVKFTPIAETDLEGIFSYISAQLSATSAAEKLIEEIEVCIMRLEELPFSGSPLSDETLSSRGYRKLVVNNYIVFYLVNEQDKQVTIMRVLYGARNYRTIL